MKQYASFDLLELRSGFLLVNVTIQGTPAYMVLNTASALSSITISEMQRLGLQAKSVPSGVVVRSGGSLFDKSVTVKDFELGSVTFKTADLLVSPTEPIRTSAGEVQVSGLLGMDILSSVDIELDLAKRKMNLFSQDHCPGLGAYWSESYAVAPIRRGKLGEIYFPMELDGKKLEATLATGNNATALFTDVTKRLYNFDRHSPDVETETLGNGGTTSSYRAMKLSGEGVQVVNARILLIDRPSNDMCHLGSRSGAAAYDGCYGAHPLQLGRDILTKLHIYIATQEKVLYFTPANAADIHSPDTAASK